MRSIGAVFMVNTQKSEQKNDQNLKQGQESNSVSARAGLEQASSSIKSHLLFHKALISDDDKNDRYDEYMDLLEQLEHGMTIVFPDPFDRAIAITFELALKHHFDPWDVDLLKFSTEYLGHVKKNKDLDLVTAGRIILMAWKILKLQSDKVLSDAQQVKDRDDDEFWHEPDGEWFTNDDDFEFTTEVINRDESPLQEMVWRKGKRKVSLIELVGALEEAKRESEIIKILTERRAEERDKLKRNRKQNINNKLHQENLQEEIEMIYGRISKFNGHPIPLSDIYLPEPEDTITTLVSSLFLAYNRRINIWQRKFPFGQIFVKNLHNEDFEGGFSIVDPDGLKDGGNGKGNGGNGNGGNGNGNGGNGGNGDENKVLLRELQLGKTENLKDVEKMDKKKKKKLKDDMEELITSQKNIAS